MNGQIDISEMLCDVCVMRTATIREAQHHFSALLRLVQRGEEIEVLSRKTPVARIVPSTPLARQNASIDWSGHGERLKKLWKGHKTGISSEKLLDELRGER